ncbi:hypothetical protein [Brucella intermedia]|uniref:hypothetical protein n=1 Tax=Brucella intermedia TaxID=94625 RepID=UPI00235FD7F9|nr:hypothetical protein [Brucella intermedia]
MDLNITASKCLNYVNSIGYQEVHNICDGTIKRIPWGGADWLLALGIGAFFIVIIVIFAGMARDLWRW